MERRRGTLRLQILAHSFRQSGVLNAAIKLDLFTVVAGGNRETSRIARGDRAQPTECPEAAGRLLIPGPAGVQGRAVPQRA
jgi:hypothetical protein